MKSSFLGSRRSDYLVVFLGISAAIWCAWFHYFYQDEAALTYVGWLSTFHLLVAAPLAECAICYSILRWMAVFRPSERIYKIKETICIFVLLAYLLLVLITLTFGYKLTIDLRQFVNAIFELFLPAGPTILGACLGVKPLEN